MRMVAVVLGGGTGQRIGAPLPKQLLKLGGRTLLEHCVAAFEQAPGVDEILVVMAGGTSGRSGPCCRRRLRQGHRGHRGRRGPSGLDPRGAGRHRLRGGWRSGRLRRAAARRGAPAGGSADHRRLRRRAGRPEAAGVAVPASDTIVITDNGVMHSMPRRETLWRCQTPQCFRLPVIARAHELAAADPDFAPTDDCGVVLRYLPGSRRAHRPGQRAQPQDHLPPRPRRGRGPAGGRRRWPRVSGGQPA